MSPDYVSDLWLYTRLGITLQNSLQILSRVQGLDPRLIKEHKELISLLEKKVQKIMEKTGDEVDLDLLEDPDGRMGS